MEDSVAFSFTLAINRHKYLHVSFLAIYIYIGSDACPTLLLIPAFHLTDNISAFLQKRYTMSWEIFSSYTFLRTFIQSRVCGLPPHWTPFIPGHYLDQILAASLYKSVVSKIPRKVLKSNDLYPTFSAAIIPMLTGWCLFVKLGGNNFIVKRGNNFHLSMLCAK